MRLTSKKDASTVLLYIPFIFSCAVEKVILTRFYWANRTMWTGGNLDIIGGMNSESGDLKKSEDDKTVCSIFFV